MFDIGFWELILVGLVALLAFGPEELPRLVRDTVRAIRKLRSAAAAASTELRRELQIDEIDQSFRHDTAAWRETRASLEQLRNKPLDLVSEAEVGRNSGPPRIAPHELPPRIAPHELPPRIAPHEPPPRIAPHEPPPPIAPHEAPPQILPPQPADPKTDPTEPHDGLI